MKLNCTLDGNALCIESKGFECLADSDAFFIPIPKDLQRDLALFFFENTEDKIYLEMKNPYSSTSTDSSSNKGL